MNGILGMAGLLLDTKLDGAQRTYAEAVRESGEALLQLINDILDYSKIEAGRMELNPAPFDIRQTVQRVSELLAPRAHEKGIEIAHVVRPGVPEEIIGDEARLRQVLLNLAGNAVKFTECGGVIIEVRPSKAGLTVAVEDTGIGISEDAKVRIFEEFSQADSSHTRRFGGTGLGLAISKRIAGALGGYLSVESEEGVGSVFRFDLPLTPPGMEDQLPDEAMIPPPSLSGHAVLLLSTGGIGAVALERQLEAEGCQVIHLLSDEGVVPEDPRIDAWPWSYIVVDHAEGALDLVGHLRVRLAPGGRLIVLVSPERRADLPDLKEAGYDAYLIKPLRHASLRAQMLSAGQGSHGGEDERLALPPPAAAGRPDLRILVAEDNPVNALLTSDLLKRVGHLADVVSDGREAVAAAIRAPYDVILMDLHMPEMDGLAAARAIRDSGGWNIDVPIIALTANAMSEDQSACLDAGMNAFLSKPIKPADLYAAIRQWSEAEAA